MKHGIYINKFVDRLQHFEAREARDFTCSLNDAKCLHSEITKLLLELEVLREERNTAPQEEVITLEVKGGSF